MDVAKALHGEIATRFNEAAAVRPQMGGEAAIAKGKAVASMRLRR